MPEQKKRIWKILIGFFLTAAVAGAIVTGAQAYRQNRAEAELERLAENTEGAAQEPAETGTGILSGAASEDGASQGGENASGTDASAEGSAGSVPDGNIQALTDMGIPVPEKKVDFADLQDNVNQDIYAWIYIPDTQIDYPVLQHPADNLYYLNHNLDGSKGYPGCIYTEDYNAREFSDPNTVIYGHNMKNGTMFAGLHRFEDSEYFEEHPYVYIYTEDKLYAYEIFAAYESGDEHILYNNDFSDDYVFQKYLSEIVTGRSMNGNIRKDISLTSENRIITLSTCVANKSDRRYLVQGVLLNED